MPGVTIGDIGKKMGRDGIGKSLLNTVVSRDAYVSS